MLVAESCFSFAYTDFAILSVVYLLLLEGATRIGIFYDIYCHWIKNFWSRIGQVLLSGPSLTPSMVFGGVGKYHIAGHTDSCNAQYSPNFIPGIGRLDAEGSERGWADINQASQSSSKKGPGFCIDSINGMMHDWNWRKITAMIAHILEKYAEATRMAEEQESQWQAFNEMINDTDLTTYWAGLSTMPQRVGNTNNYTSVFISQEGTGTLHEALLIYLTNSHEATSILRALLDLNKEEQAAKSNQGQENGFTALEIESQQ
ncbi:hypothetical protein FRC09_016329 [Ceratobasidium sp. 395]|nr:hypothetical protein FRC09_016329 [Ceratobasidium sp. 395]